MPSRSTPPTAPDSATTAGRTAAPGDAVDPAPPRPPTPQAIREAAAVLFARDGFTATTVRGIAAAAGVNQALVIRRFGSKEGLFLDVMALPSPDAGRHRWPPHSRLDRVLAGPVGGLGERLARWVLTEAEAEESRLRDTVVALKHAVESREIRDRLQQVTDEQLVQPVAAQLSGPSAELRARLVTAQLVGLMDALWGTTDNPLAGFDREEVVALYGAALQRIVEPAHLPG